MDPRSLQHGKEAPLVHVLTDAEALAVVKIAGQRLRAGSSIQPKERKKEVQWVVSNVAKYLEGSLDPATTRSALTALSELPLSEMTKVKLVNARARTEIRCYLADTDSPVEATEVAQVMDRVLGGKGGEEKK